MDRAEFREQLILNPRFDFLHFYEQNLFTDCEIHVYDSDQSSDRHIVRGHRVILANTSLYFENAFTSGMREAETGIVEARGVPFPHFAAVVRYLYSGNISFDDDSVVWLFYIARHFGIQSLHNLLFKCAAASPPEAILGYVAQCFNYELTEELRMLEPIIASHYTNMTMQNLTRALDVVTFLNVLALVDKTIAEKFDELEKFLGDWNCSPAERVAIAAAFGAAPPEIQARFRTPGRDWLPENFAFR
jgi:hypothetical protein